MLKLVRQDVKNIGHITDYKGIERIARLCYKSEDKITEKSYLKFIKMLLKNGHLSVLEHLNIILKVGCMRFSGFNNGENGFHIRDHFFLSPFFQKTILNDTVFIVSGSLRAFYEYCLEQEYFLILEKILLSIGDFDEIFGELKKKKTRDEIWISRMNIEVLSVDDIINNYSKLKIFSSTTFLIKKHIAHTFYVICNRGISHEYVRHRYTHAITQESTRFVKYDEVEIILPIWFYEITDENREAYKIWWVSCDRDANAYKLLLKLGYTPQQARDNLPHSLRTSLYSTMSLWQWGHFLRLRMSEKAHPLIREIAGKIKNYLKIEYPCVF